MSPRGYTVTKEVDPRRCNARVRGTGPGRVAMHQESTDASGGQQATRRRVPTHLPVRPNPTGGTVSTAIRESHIALTGEVLESARVIAAAAVFNAASALTDDDSVRDMHSIYRDYNATTRACMLYDGLGGNAGVWGRTTIDRSEAARLREYALEEISYANDFFAIPLEVLEHRHDDVGIAGMRAHLAHAERVLNYLEATA